MIFSAFTLQKENLETLEAIGLLAAELDVLPSDFSYTGIKDKKAITLQPMVVKKVTPERYLESGYNQFSTLFFVLISIKTFLLMCLPFACIEHSGSFAALGNCSLALKSMVKFHCKLDCKASCPRDN